MVAMYSPSSWVNSTSICKNKRIISERMCEMRERDERVCARERVREREERVFRRCIEKIYELIDALRG